MGTKQKPADRGSSRARSILIELGGEIRRARTEHGLSQHVVATSVGLSASSVSRIERAEVRHVSVLELARLLAVVGMELSARAYPAGRPIRDRAQLALLARFRAGLGAPVSVRSEVPLPIPGDDRAWDLVLTAGSAQIAVEAETRPRDVQALLRRIATKRRDDPRIAHVILLLADTRHNRLMLREHGRELRGELPLGSDQILDSLREGRDPGGSGIVLM